MNKNVNFHDFLAKNMIFRFYLIKGTFLKILRKFLTFFPLPKKKLYIS